MTTRQMYHEVVSGDGAFREHEITEGATPASIELSLTSKGTYTWSLKEYVEAGAMEDPARRAEIVDGLKQMDTLLRGYFTAARA